MEISAQARHFVLSDAHSLSLSHSLHLSQNLSSSTITTMSKVLHLPRKLHIEVKQLQSLALSRKVITMCENAHGATTRAQSLEARARPHPDFVRAVEMHFDDFEKHECAVNSSELAGYARPLQRSKHQLLFSYRKNP